MPRYQYDPALTTQQNNRLALAVHEADGPMVGVTARHGSDRITTHFLCPDGATLGHDPRECVKEPATPGCADVRRMHPMDAAHAVRATLANVALYWRIRSERAATAFAAAQRRAVEHSRPTADMLENVRALRAELRKCRARFATAEAELNPKPDPLPPPTAEQRAKRAAEDRAVMAREDMRAQIANVEE